MSAVWGAGRVKPWEAAGARGDPHVALSVCTLLGTGVWARRHSLRQKKNDGLVIVWVQGPSSDVSTASSARHG